MDFPTWGYMKNMANRNKFQRAHILTLLTVTTITWTCLITLGLVIGIVPTTDLPQWCRVIWYNATSPSPAITLKQPVSIEKTHPTVRPLIPGSTTTKGTAYYTQDLDPSCDKVILRWTKFYGKNWDVPPGRKVFEELKCPEKRCFLTDDKYMLHKSDALLVHMRDVTDPAHLPKYRKMDQRWIFYLLESPLHTGVNLTKFNGLFNWTLTYTRDADIPAPYGKYVHYKDSVNVSSTFFTDQPHSQRKPRMAAWLVTNCKATNHREDYVKALQNYIPVDTYGPCGKLKCHDDITCKGMLQNSYKFYIAFENSNCKEYITEKFWYNALINDIVPVVMGASREDYEKLAPPHSFIHVNDFPSAKELARYLRLLHRDSKLYNQYFRWKGLGRAEAHIYFSPRYSSSWCDLCAALHDPSKPNKVHNNLDEWWSAKSQCS